MISDHLVNDRETSGLGLAGEGVLVVVSAGWRAAATCGRLLGSFVQAGLRPPLASLGLDPERLLRQLSDRGRANRTATVQRVDAFASAAIPWAVSAVLDRLDLTAMVIERVDLDTVATQLDLGSILDRVDLDAMVARVDLDRIVARLDVPGLALWVIESVDLPGIIRESSSSVATQTVKGVRAASLEADQAVSGVVDRILLRRRGRNLETSWGRTSTGDPGADDDTKLP